MPPHNILILGSGRSGTSMLSGLVRHAGLYQGKDFLSTNAGNPTGYYEDWKLNNINNEVLKRLLHWRWITRLPRAWRPLVAHDERLLWLAAPAKSHPVPLHPGWVQQMKAHFAQQPFCLKDPRFTFTLPTWRPHLPANTRFLVAFRRPEQVVESVLRFCQKRYQEPLPVQPEARHVLGWWREHYRQLLDEHSRAGDWLFVHFDQIVSGEAVPQIEDFTGAKMDASEANEQISESKGDSLAGPLAEECRVLYRRLCEKAGYALV